MSFAHPLVLLALVVPLALAFFELSRHLAGAGVRVAVPVDFSADTAQAFRRRPWARGFLTTAALLPILILAIAVLLLAGPQTVGPPAEGRVMTNIELLLDVSGSMASPMGSSTMGDSRSAVAMSAIKEFLDDRKDDACGLTIFGGEALRWVPLTKDHTAIANAGPFLDPRTMPGPLNSTELGKALRFTMNTMLHQRLGQEVADGDKVIIAITDGESFDLGGGAASQIGAELRDAHITLHAIYVGEGEPQAELTDVVSPTGGLVFQAEDHAGLSQIFSTINAMQPAKIKSIDPQPVDWFTPFAITGLVLLGLHTLALMGLRYTPW